MRNNLLWAAAYAGCAAAVILSLTAAGFIYVREGATTWATWTIREVQTAAVFFAQSITAEQIRNDYRGIHALESVAATRPAGGAASGGKVRVLIVPGHQPGEGGTGFGGVYERDLVIDIADALTALLAQNPHYDVMVARTRTAWHPVLQSYFDTHALDIETFKQSLAIQMQDHLADGSILVAADQVYHNGAPSAAAFQLYGINKWTSDNGYDITLHLHANDEASRRASTAGRYDGFAIYVPDRQYSNAAASKAIAEAIAGRLNAFHATSTLPKEDTGVVEDQQLIAIGSNNSANSAALLIEYGYIYEPQFQNPSIRPVAVADYAYQTYLGLQDFFKDPVPSTYGSVAFPYDWSKVTAAKNERGPGIYALQEALHYLGFYPPAGKSFSDCPISGKAGPCTLSAITAYQRAHGLEATGELGPQTRAALARDLAIP